MPKSRTDQMVERLRDLQASTGDIEGSAVVSVDGLIMASSLPAGVEEDRVSAMSAAMLSLGERIATELGRGIALAHYAPQRIARVVPRRDPVRNRSAQLLRFQRRWRG